MRRDTLTSHDDTGLGDRVQVSRTGSEVIQKFTERSHELAILVRQQANRGCRNMLSLTRARLPG